MALAGLIGLAACGSSGDDDDRANGGPNGSDSDGGIAGEGGTPDGGEAGVPAPPFYVLDLSSSYVNCFAGCKAAGNAAGNQKTLDGLDALVFATSVQGIVNRSGPRLYVIATPADQFWLDQATDATHSWGWAAAHPQIKLSSVTDLLTTFASDIHGTVRWSAAAPASLDVATTAAGVEGLAIVREKSTLETAIETAWPVQTDLAGKYANKRAAYADAHAKYLTKTKPGFLAYQQDGYPWARLAAGSDGSDFDGPAVLSRDYLIAEKAYVFDLSPWSDQAPVDDPSQPAGADTNEMVSLLDTAHTAMKGADLAQVWGFYEVKKYSTGAHTEPVSGEWTTVKLFSQHGARLTGSGGQSYGLEMGNASFHRWGTFPKHAPRHASPTPTALADAGIVNQRLLNPGFDWNSLDSWTIDAPNRVIESSGGPVGGHEHFLEMNGAVDQGI
ncbi:MAG TPA: GxGYxYP domain-containing protein, partial [Polyangiaceae bacterium]